MGFCRILFTLLLSCILGLVACKDKNDPVAIVGSETISLDDLNNKIQELSTYNANIGQSETERKQILDNMVREQIMLGVALQRGYDKDEEIMADVQRYRDQVMLTKLVLDLRNDELKVTDAEVQEIYNEDKAYYDSPLELNASHILVPSEEEANTVLAELRAGKDFATLATSYSVDTGSKGNGGNLGWFTKGDMIPVFEEATMQLANGEISAPIKSEFGYHIIKRENSRNIDPIPFESVQTKLTRIIEKDKFDAWYEKMAAKKKIKFNAELLANNDNFS